MVKEKCVAMLLAGGQGSRLKELTTGLAKPAVPYGGKYRIIDFPLSNCANSGIHTVGVLTQYQPLVLNSYIGIGSAWDLDRKTGGVTVLPPYSETEGVKWYSGTANAIYQNLNYLKQYDPEHVLILSGDHIYKMNYAKMLNFHIEKEADVTISVIEVPWNEASRFGIMSTNQRMEITDFEEKPKKPTSNLASMGIYIFKWSVLKEYLEIDEGNPKSTNDFGKDVIPLMLREKLKLFAYPFSGYWKDVGTIQSLWEANMDLLDQEEELDLLDHSWRIYSVNPNQPPQFIGEHAIVKNSLVNEGCVIEGEVIHSVLFQGVQVEEKTVIKDAVIMPNARIGRNCVIERAIVISNLEIPDNVEIYNHTENILLITEEYLAQLIEQKQ
ncbi:glucose-1-phosphate adenylyltransferase [Bacillus sp. REN10]|uniref:glucose-1-phosphate adenylyltransferase n=1 Tax=Bacillus sp. REN10 TaxID=2782541 RepID=UPI00193C5E6A|nr:glucose-1-phosphate adenylyltransferase [Bacillus sp. REN10]